MAVLGTPLDIVAVTITTSTAVGLPSVPLAADRCVVQPWQGDIRWTDDGSTATASYGMVLREGDTWQFDSPLADISMASMEPVGEVQIHCAYYTAPI